MSSYGVKMGVFHQASSFLLLFAQPTPSSLHSSNGECPGHRSCHTMVTTVQALKWMLWPSLLDFKTCEGSGSGLTQDLLGKPWLEFKTDMGGHTHVCRQSGTHSVFLEGPLRASLSSPPTHSSLLTLTTAVTTCILFSWIFQALQSSRCCYIYSA